MRKCKATSSVGHVTNLVLGPRVSISVTVQCSDPRGTGRAHVRRGERQEAGLAGALHPGWRPPQRKRREASSPRCAVQIATVHGRTSSSACWAVSAGVISDGHAALSPSRQGLCSCDPPVRRLTAPGARTQQAAAPGAESHAPTSWFLRAESRRENAGTAILFVLMNLAIISYAL